MALAITPRGDFGYLLNLQGFKARLETLAQVGPHSWRNFLVPSGGIAQIIKIGIYPDFLGIAILF